MGGGGGGGIQMMMIYYYLYFLIDEIWLDLQDNIFLGIILFSVLAKFNLICRIWAIQVIQDFAPSGLDLSFGLAQRGLNIALGTPSLWAWRVGMRAHFSNPISCPPALVYGMRGQGL